MKHLKRLQKSFLYFTRRHVWELLRKLKNLLVLKLILLLGRSKKAMMMSSRPLVEIEREFCNYFMLRRKKELK
jgi:hypothetical protein